ncbi:guanine deaminase [Nocardioides albus]|uniref:Guanine deaminase n=1 Tax=Nocardioides albus TaxID=1841 RepID=A0A7W5F7T8_9ACTN|nr:guanine deaminase [Nocardioides albus]MBB3088346.1 guanine deaminase [Nocardioides albus]GGU42099.1 putative guanine deaminase [Nocardioides albus]
MTLYRGTFLDTPDDPFTGGRLRTEQDGALLVRDGVIRARGRYADLHRQHSQEDVVDLSGGFVLPGFVDTHVHFPQVRVIGGLGLPLLDWLDQCALPEEARLADTAYAAGVATDFVRGLVGAGTTTALVFGSHFAPAVDTVFAEAARVGLRITSGLVVSDRLIRDDLLTDPERGRQESLALAARWHGVGRARYAVTPRFSLSCTDDLLAACADVLGAVPGAMFTSHVNENTREIEVVEELCGCDYVTSYDRHGLVGAGTVLAHNVHPTDAELTLLAARGASVAHCASSNAALGSGLFPLARHRAHGVHVAMGSDVGAGTGFSLLKEGLAAYVAQQQLGEAGHPLTPTHLLHLATRAGAAALGLSADVGDLSVGRRFDAQWIKPAASTPLAVGLTHAADPADALAKMFALGTPADVRSVWIEGELIDTPDPHLVG